MGLHSVMPLDALFFGLVHLRLALTYGVLGRNWRGDDGGVYHGATLQQQASGLEDGVDGLEELLGKLVLLQQVAKPQDADPIRKSGVGIQASKVTIQRRLKQGIFHGEHHQPQELLQSV